MPGPPAASCGEENLLCFPGDPYAAENILIHEFGHVIHEMGLAQIDRTFQTRLVEAFAEAGRAGRWVGTYARTSPSEYWAQGVQSRFACNRTSDEEHGTVNSAIAVRDHGLRVAQEEIPRLTERAWAIRHALEHGGITGDRGETIDHVVLLGPAAAAGNDGRAFVLCPDGAFDRSPCGTGTSALVACLHEDGLLPEGRIWRQESVLGGVYEASVRRTPRGLVPTIRGRAWITAESTLHFAAGDPYRLGLTPPLTGR